MSLVEQASQSLDEAVETDGGALEALGRLHARQTHEGTAVHPADLDDALCVGTLIGFPSGGETRLPFAVDDAFLQGSPGALWAAVGRQRGGSCRQTG